VTPTAKRALQQEALASGNVVKHLADRVLQGEAARSAGRSPSARAAVLYWGLLSAYDKTGDRRYLDAVRSWAERQLEVKGDQAHYAGLVLSELAYRVTDDAARDRFLGAAARIAAEVSARLEPMGGASSDVDLALRAILLASVAEARRDLTLWQRAHDSLVRHFRAADRRRADARALGEATAPVETGEDVMPVEGKVVPTQVPVADSYDNSWMLLALSHVRSHGLPFKGEYFEDVPELRGEGLLQSYVAVRELPGSGEIWPNLLQAALNIAAIKELQRRKDLFKDVNDTTQSDLLRLRPDSPEILPLLEEVRTHIRKIAATNYNADYGFPRHRDFDYTIDLLRLYVDSAKDDMEMGAFLLALDPDRRISFEPEVAAVRE